MAIGDVPQATFVAPRFKAGVATMETNRNGSPRSNSKIHERRIPSTFPQHIERHQEKYSNHVDVRIFQHSRECLRLSSLEKPLPNSLRTCKGVTLSPNGGDKVFQDRVGGCLVWQFRCDRIF